MLQTTQPKATPSVFDQALQQYPILQNLNLAYKSSPGAQPYMLEMWQPGNEYSGTEEKPYKRPKELPIDRPSIEVYSNKVRPIDILGDVVSHYMVEKDPKIKKYYNQFKESLTSDQKQRLKAQYEWAKKNEGESRAYAEWERVSGLPAYFRGYAFQQWPNPTLYYTDEQRKMFDEMMGYLSMPAPKAN